MPVNTGNFVTSIEGNLPNYLTSNPASYNFNYSNLGNIETADFCLEPNQAINDVNISILTSSANTFSLKKLWKIARVHFVVMEKIIINVRIGKIMNKSLYIAFY